MPLDFCQEICYSQCLSLPGVPVDSKTAKPWGFQGADPSRTPPPLIWITNHYANECWYNQRLFSLWDPKELCLPDLHVDHFAEIILVIDIFLA